MISSRISIVGVLSVFIVAGCGGGGPDEPDRPDIGGPEIGGPAATLLEKYESTEFTDPASLPTSGSATYNGSLQINADGVSAVGDMQLVARFGNDADPIGGTMSNIVDSDGFGYEGTLSMANGTLSRTVDPETGNTFEADLGGNLVYEGDTLVVDARVQGDFLGTDHEAVRGEVSGSIGTPQGTSVITGGNLIGER